MPNYAELLKLMSKLPKGSKAAQELVAADVAAREAAQKALYAGHTPPTETGRKAIAQAKQTLITPEQQAKLEAEMREKGKKKFLEPSKIKQRLYHGTNKNIQEFDPATAAKQTGNPTSYFGTFLSDSPKEAGRYARDWQHGGTYGGNIMPVHVQMTNPYPMSYKEYNQYAEGEFNRFIKNPSEEMKDTHRQEAMQDVLARKQQLIDQGYDGIVVKIGGINEYIPFSPNQIKSSIGNRGTYDITDPDITKKNGGLAMATGGQPASLFSQLEAELERRRPRTRAGVPVKDTNVMGGTLQGLGEMLLGAGRGATAVGLGAPADILNMIDLPKLMTGESYQIPYGSEYFLENLPLEPTTHTGKTAQTLGQFLPINPEQPVKAVLSGAKKAGKALAPTAIDMMQMQLERATAPTRSYVIKPEGGNWINAATDKFLKNLRYDESMIDPIGIMNPADKAEETARVAAMNNFVDKKLSRYVQNQMATPSDPLRLQADAWVDTQKALLADKDKQIAKVRSDMRRAQQARGVDPEVLTRSQARLRELQKERELIQNRKGLHFEPLGGENSGTAFEAASRRRLMGAPTERMAKSEIGKRWEDTSDLAIMQQPYMEHEGINVGKTYAELKGSKPQEYMDEVNAALQKIGGKFAVENPEALAYRTSSRSEYIGFEHMMDEIDNALRPSQGLPDYLQLTPKELDKMSVAQVSEHVDKINAWRASQKAEVDKARAANAATVEHKAYDVVPGTDIPNEQGLRWVEIKAPDASTIELPEGVTRRQMSTIQGGLDVPGVGYVDAKYSAELGDLNWAEAEEKAKKILASKPVEDALKYEGEMLSHCVGGYCPDVVEGRSRIFSLRDAEGRPHATIEVKPDDFRQVWRTLTTEQQNEVNSILNRWTENIDYRPSREELEAKGEQILMQLGYTPPEKISQIKGLQNRKPDDQYMPFIQDFVKSGQWSDVRDFHHTNLFKVTEGQKLPGFSKEIPPGYYTLQDFEKMAVENEMPQEILESWLGKLKDQSKYGYADGGAVHPAVDEFASNLPHPAVIDLEQMMTKRMMKGFASGGVVDGNVWKQMLDAQQNTTPDVTDSGQIIRGPALADGGDATNAWKELLKGARNA